MIAILPLIDRELTAGGTTLGAGTGIGDATFLAKWRSLKKDRGRGTLQRGSGSWDPTAALTWTYVPNVGAARWVLTGDVGGTITTAANGFERGSGFAYDTAAKYRVLPAAYPGRDTFLLLELNGRWQEKAESAGIPIANSGGNVIYIPPGVQFLMYRNLVLEAGVQIPIVRNLNGEQLGTGVNTLFGLRYIIIP